MSVSKFLSRLGGSKRLLSTRLTATSLIQSHRSFQDRSFRLANVADLQAAQGHKESVQQELWTSYAHSAPLRERDISKQLIIDLSHEQGYRRGHIKGAVNLPLEKFDFTRPIETMDGITQDEVYQVMKDIGIGNDTSEVILYDNSGLLACRLYWVLRYFGFVNIRVLNGGWRAWLQAGLPVSEKDVIPEPATSLDLKQKRENILTKPSNIVRDFQEKASVINEKRAQYVDTRRPEAYKAYHIESAKNIPSKLIMEDARFASVKQIRDVCENKGVELEGKKVICYSSKGLSSTVVWFGLEIGGCEKTSVYDAGIKNWYQNFEDKLSMEAIEHLSQ